MSRPKTMATRVIISLPQKLLDRIDHAARYRLRSRTRSGAIRELIEIGLAAQTMLGGFEYHGREFREHGIKDVGRASWVLRNLIATFLDECGTPEADINSSMAILHEQPTEPPKHDRRAIDLRNFSLVMDIMAAGDDHESKRIVAQYLSGQTSLDEAERQMIAAFCSAVSPVGLET